MSKLDVLREERKAAYARMKEVAEEIEAADVQADLEELEARFKETETECKALDQRIENAEARAKALANAPVDPVGDDEVEGSPKVSITSQPSQYSREGRNSYFGDLVKCEVHKDSEAGERLSSHGKEMRDLSRTDGAGGEFVPPLWLQEEWIALQRAGRVTADLVGSLPLPAGTNSINIPKVSTGTAAAIQTADNAAVSEADAVTTSISVPVHTIAGQQDISLQAVEQSMPGLDQVMAQDLAADYAAKLDAQVINGSGASGQATGILNTSSILSVTYTDASPSVPELYPKFADGIQQIHAGRYMSPTAIVMHPRRWGFLEAAVDSSNRPLVTPYAPFNAAGVKTTVAAEGAVGSIQGLPVYLDPNIPVNLGGSTNEDRIIICRYQDYKLWESQVRTRVLSEVLSGNLTVRVQVYGYLAFTAARYPSSTAVISGTGLATPTF